MSNRDLTSLRNLFTGLGIDAETLAKKAPPTPKKPRHKAPVLNLTPIPPGLDDAIRPEDVGYTHPVLLQCFLPVRHNKNNADWWQTNCGRASIAISAGRLVKPGAMHEFSRRQVPAGPKARLVSAYVNDFIHSHRTPVVPLGDSMRQAMQRMGIPVCGSNGDELTRELENFAAAEILIGVWDSNGSAHQTGGKIAKAMSFWIERNPDQGVFWQPELTVSTEYFDAVLQREMTPFHWPSLVALSHNARAMDIHCFLTYRLHKGLAKPVELKRSTLHAMFGQGIRSEKQFWPEFKEALGVAHKQYPTARVEIMKDRKGYETGLLLKNSPPLIPHRKLARIR